MICLLLTQVMGCISDSGVGSWMVKRGYVRG